MGKNIYIHVGSFATIYQIMQYFRKDKDFLEKKGYCFPLLSDFSNFKDDSTSTLSFYENITGVWESELWRNASATIESSEYSQKLKTHGLFEDTPMLPSNLDLAHILKNIKKHADENSSIHSLCMFLHPTEYDRTQVIFLKHIQLFFPEYKVHVRYITLPFDKIVPRSWCASFFYGQYDFLAQEAFYASQNIYTMNDNLKNLLISIKGSSEKYFGNSSFSVAKLNEETEVLPDFKAWTHIPHSETQLQLNSLLFSPPVLTFLMGLSFINPRFRSSLLVEDNFLTYKADDKPHNYLQAQTVATLKKAYNEIHEIQEEITVDKDQKAEIILSLSTEDAKILARLISSDVRKNLINNFTVQSLKHKTINQRRACAALLLAENQITEAECDDFCSLALGYILPYDTKENDDDDDDDNNNFFDTINSREIPKISTHVELYGEAPKVTVITLCYNHKNFIEQNIKSVLMQQTNFPVTHVIADDFSDDGTRDLLLKYAKKYPHIKLILRDFNCITQNVHDLFNEARSPYVIPCDGDDYFLDCAKLQTQVDFMEANPKHALCFHPVLITYEDCPGTTCIFPDVKQLPRGKMDNFYLADLIRCNFIQTNSVMYRWRFQNGLPSWFNTTLNPGDWHWHIFHAESGTIGFQKQIMSVYRRHAKGLYISSIDGAGALRRRHAASEIIFYKFLNEYFKERYYKIFIDNQLQVFLSLSLDAEQHSDTTAFEYHLSMFPDLGVLFKKKLPEMLLNAVTKLL